MVLLLRAWTFVANSGQVRRVLRDNSVADIPATFQAKENVKLAQQFKACDRESVPVAVIVGSGEIEKGVVGIKDQTREGAKQQEVPRGELVQAVQNMLREQKLIE